ncbi:MAG: hypothetical protein ACRBN8_40750 [Nannocystales bacterium]
MHPPHGQGPGQQPYPPQQQPAGQPAPSPGFQSAAAKKRAKRAESGGGALELLLDKSIDFALIFVGLYAATALQRCQDTAKEKQEYVSLLQDFKRELKANVEQEASIEKDLGAIDKHEPGENLGPMQDTFKHFFEELEEDEKVVKCLHDEFAVDKDPDHPEPPEGCHDLYAKFDTAHSEHKESFNFRPAVLTPFYRKEVWQLYLADGVKTFRNKELAVDIAEVYANAELIEEQVKDIETTYNDAFMAQVGRTAATDMELAEIVHDEETHHGLSGADLTLLLHVDEAIKGEHYASLEVERTLELKVERMKKTVLIMREEIAAVQTAIDAELAAQGSEGGGSSEE